jgi:cytidine deaminase
MRLIDKDEKEIGDVFGQNVRDTYPEADIFLQMQEKEALRSQVARVLDCLFGYPFTTPTRDEYAMFHASAAALRSADLSRQVGAAIANDHGDIVAVGCNEVPKAGGGSVWDMGGKPIAQDYRDYRLGFDSNARLKRDMLAEALRSLHEAGLLRENIDTGAISNIADSALSKGGYLRDSRLASILEFGRIVHAEMTALMDAARRGIAVRGLTLYCTTFPCHMCTRHIIASGINRVVYIEPYPKSIAKELYKNSIRVENDNSDDDAVQFDPFIGISPRIFMDFFSVQDRKRKTESGDVIHWEAISSIPRFGTTAPHYVENEIAALY